MAAMEIITRAERRRRWSRADRARILAECAMPDAIIAEVCRRNDIVSSLVHKWRKEERDKGARGLLPPFIGYGELAALPQQDRLSGDYPVIADRCERQSPSGSAAMPTGVIEIALPGGIQVSVRGDVSDRAPASVFQCLRHGSC